MTGPMEVTLSSGERYVGSVIVTLIRVSESGWRLSVDGTAPEVPGSPLDLELLLALRRKVELHLKPEP